MRQNKVYTLTCTWAPSYGAVLQAYALAKKINNLGWQAKIINYQPDYYNTTPVKKILAPLHVAKKFLLERLYIDFLHDSGMLTKKKYSNFDDLKEDSDLSAGAFVVGSDQVWNCTKYYNGKDDAMFLDFAQPNAKRVSYAASLAMSEIPQEQGVRYKDMLSKFDAISVRERTGAKALADVGIENTEIVIDPVYLINKDEWAKLAEKSDKDFSKEKYVLVVCLEERDSMYEYARRKADMLGVKLYSLKTGIRAYKKYASVDKCFRNISVYDYLTIMKNAEAVIADSFHAMSFSLIFNRNIDVIPREDKGNSRMIDLLNGLGIADRVTTPDRVITDNIDFALTNKIIAEKTNEAQIFLEESLR